MFSPIHFRDIAANYNDRNSLVMLGVIFDYNEYELRDVDNTLHYMGVLPEYARLTDLRKVDGNVKGSRGRSDVLLCFDECEPNAMAIDRFNRDIKPTSRFLTLYKKDYFD